MRRSSITKSPCRIRRAIKRSKPIAAPGAGSQCFHPRPSGLWASRGRAGSDAQWSRLTRKRPPPEAASIQCLFIFKPKATPMAFRKASQRGGPPAFESRGSLISVVLFGAPTRLYRRGVGCTHRRFHIGLIKKNFSRTARCRRFHKREVRFFRPVWSSLTSFRCCSIISAIRRRGANRRSAA